MSNYRGSPLGIKLIMTLHDTFGYSAAKGVVFIVALFYALVSNKNRKALSSYYEAVGEPNTFKSYFKHVYAFSLAIFDRFIAKEGMQEKVIEVERLNVEAFESLQKSGGMLILSHHGNWAQSFKIFQTYDVKLNITGNEAINADIQRLETDKEHNERIHVINLQEGMQAMLEIARALQNKEIIIIMVDRVQELEKSVAVDFLGRPTFFHSGAFEIAQMRKAPILGCDIVRTGDNRIKVEFSDIITSKKKAKQEAISDLAQQYADFLTQVVRQYPYQWFNFFDFWGKRP